MEIGMVPNPTLRVRKEAKRERESWPVSVVFSKSNGLTSAGLNSEKEKVSDPETSEIARFVLSVRCPLPS